MQPAVKAARIEIQPSDEMLIERTRCGDLESYEKLFNRYCGQLFEYAHGLLPEDQDLAVKIFLKAFLDLYKRLDSYQFQQKTLAQLFRSCNLLASKAIRKAGELNRIPLEDRSLLLMVGRFNFSMGTAGWVLRQIPTSVLSRFNEMSPVASTLLPEERVAGSYKALDYWASLQSKIERYHQERKSFAIGMAAIVSIAILVTAPGVFKWPSPFFPKSSAASTQAPAAQGRQVLLQKFQTNRYAEFIREENFAEESLRMAAGRGKALAFDYEFFKIPSSVALVIELKSIDLSRYSGFSFWIKGDSQLNHPKALSLFFKNSGRLIVKSNISSIQNGWSLVRVPLNVNAVADSISFIIEGDQSGPQRSGRIYLDQLSLEEKF